jgi:outer membrane protein assembly factor BamB
VLFVTVRGPEQLVLDPASGETIDSHLPTGAIVWSQATNTAITSFAEAIDLATGASIWRTHIRQGADAPPVLADGLLLLRAGRFEGTVTALDRTTGEILFSSARPAVGNLVRMDPAVLWLSADGHLLSWTPGEGQETALASFGASRFETDCDSRGYYIAADASTGTIIAYLADTSELIALTLSP